MLAVGQTTEAVAATRQYVKDLSAIEQNAVNRWRGEGHLARIEARAGNIRESVALLKKTSRCPAASRCPISGRIPIGTTSATIPSSSPCSPIRRTARRCDERDAGRWRLGQIVAFQYPPYCGHAGALPLYEVGHSPRLSPPFVNSGYVGLLAPEVHYARGLPPAQRQQIEARDRAELRR